MMRIIEILPAGSWDENQAADVYHADYEGRHRRRKRLELQSGAHALLDLEKPRLLMTGDGLKLEDDRIVRVESQKEKLLRVTATSPLHLLKLAWHLGNRHLPAAIHDDYILIRNDHVIANMVTKLSGYVAEVDEAFSPETGAYSGDDDHGHSHSHHDHSDHSHADGGHHHSHHH